jgi:predicted DNA-binding transcriptional regulator YafY
MAENSNKIKLLKLYELLQKDTDEDKPLTKTEICRRLNEQDVSCSVRTIERDVDALQQFGFEIISFKKDHERYYYVPEREFSIPELKILMDAVQAASFVTDKKTKELIDKIAALGGSYRADLLKRNMVNFNTRKHSNEKILYTVDSIEDAIRRKKKIAFHYFYLNEKKERVFQCKDTGEKKRYYVEPVAMIMSEDNYYLMTYSSRHPEKTANYRLDRMDQVEVVEESVLSNEALEKINGVAEFTEQAFKMYGGELEDILIQFDRALIGPVIDKFGEDTPMMQVNDNECAATVHVQVSPTFFGWVFQFGEKMKIISPIEVITEFQNLKK